MSYSPSAASTCSDVESVFSTMSVPISIVINNLESENSGSTFVTPQQKRRRAGPPKRNNRKLSAPPELQAHLGQKATQVPTIITPGRHKARDAADLASAPEFIINFNSSSNLALPEGLNSGSDSGVPSEYSSWAAPIGRPKSNSPYEDNASRSISGSLECIPGANNRDRSYSSSSSSSDEEDMSSQNTSQQSEGISNPAFVNTEGQRHNAQVPINAASLYHPVAPTPPPPHPLNRAQTDTSLLPGALQQRGRTNSMVFQLNLANGIPGMTNTLPNARSVSMISLNTAGNNQIAYPSLSSFNHDNQSVYSDAGVIHPPGFLGMGNQMGSQGSLSGLGYGAAGNINPPPPPEDEIAEATPTDPIVKQSWFIDTLCENLSTMYAILLFMIGCVLYLADVWLEFKGKDNENYAMGEAFNVYLILVQLLWLIYIHVDVRKYVNTIANALEEAKGKQDQGGPVSLETTQDGLYQLRINLPEPKKTFAQFYGFTSGRHGGSLYLKIGAAVFCLGFLIHSGLNLGHKVLYAIDDNPNVRACTCAQDLIMSVLQPIYAFYQLFFIFKFSNLIINRRRRFARFALMHCISASLLFWVYTIIQETLQAINSKKNKDPVYHNITYVHDDSGERDDDIKDMIKDDIHFSCNMTTPLTKMINDTTPYLYPFSIEYNILVVGIWILLWENIGRMDRHTHLPSIKMTYEDDHTQGITSNLIIYVDCHSSNRGLFAGLFMTVATVISIILFFIFTANPETVAHGLKVNGYSEIVVHGIMIIVTILCYRAIRNLDIVKNKISKVDDILLYICLPCIFLYAMFSMVPAIAFNKPLFVAVSVVQVVQAVVQTALICDGLRRCSNSSSLTTRKPGREMITFMVVANIALWLLETFEIKSVDGNYFKYKFYGKEGWTLISHMTLPLALFYRFHSSVCLADIWKGGYENENEH